MKYFKIAIKAFYENGMIATNAEGKDIEDAEYYFNKLRDGEILNNPPVFDCFYLKSFDRREYWEWKLCDVLKFIGEGSQIKGWLISNDLKLLLENFIIAEPHYFYLSKLLYKEEKLDYYIFQFAGKFIFKQTILHIDYTKTIFWNPLKQQDVFVSNKEEFISEYQKIYKENGGLENIVQNKKLVLKEKFDFFPMGTFMKDDIVSENLKKAIEENGITGFEFSELDYEVIVED